jgi:putative ABC transport system substrate-binding protein
MSAFGRLLIAACACALVSPLAAQPAAKTARIGYVSTQSQFGGRTWSEAFRGGLRDLGYIEGRNIAIEARYADGDYGRLPRLVQEVIDLKVDVIVAAGGLPAAQAAKAANTTIPVVLISGGNLEYGIVSNLAHPGGNITGVEVFVEQLEGKRLELLKEILPGVELVAVLWNPARTSDAKPRAVLESAARAIRVKLRFATASNAAEIDTALAAVGRSHPGALLVAADPMFGQETRRIVNWAAASRVPTVHTTSFFVQEGGFMSYGADFAAIYRRAAIYVDKILKGAKPGDLPVEQPTKYELVINMKTAKALGVKIPESVLFRADRVIE